MKTSRAVIALSVIILVSVSAIGIGFALQYHGTAITESTLSPNGYSIEIKNGDAVLEDYIELPGPDTSDIVDGVISTYSCKVNIGDSFKLIVGCPEGESMEMTVQAVMKYDRSWALIKTMAMTISNDTFSKTITFVSAPQEEVIKTITVGGESIDITGYSRTISPSDKFEIPKGEYSLSLNVEYDDDTFYLDNIGTVEEPQYDASFIDFTGSNIMFMGEKKESA